MFQNNKTNHISPLASQLMDMFDASKLEATLLRKREFQAQDNFYQSQLQKKIKTSTINTTVLTRPPVQLSSMNPMAYNLNSQFNPLMAALGGNQTFGLQNFALMKQQKEAMLNLQPLSFPPMMAKKEELYVKQEYIKQEEEEVPTSEGTPSSQPFKSVLSDNQSANDQLSQGSPVVSEAVEMPEPALMDFTRQFPDWDLATIFDYIKSGKSKELFEKEKQCKIERKLKKKNLRLAQKAKGTASQEKPTKGKKI